MTKNIINFALFILFLLPAQAMASVDFAENFKAYLSNETIKTEFGEPLYKDDIIRFYEAREFQPVWFDQNNRKINDIGKMVAAINKQAYFNGLEPADYKFKNIMETKNKGSADALFEREWMLTNSVMHYINDIRTGRILPNEYDPMIFNLPQHRALDVRAKGLIDARNKDKYLESLVPQQADYKQLRQKLADYRTLSENGGWPKIDIEKKALIYVGEAHEAIPQIRERLDKAFHNFDGELPEDVWVDETQIATEELTDRIAHQDLAKDKQDEKMADVNPEFVYDAALAKKVAEFQYFHGLKADGVIGPYTIAALTTPVETQINKIVLAMERWRWLPDDLGQKHIRVNVAAFYARAVENGQDQFVMPIIVGEVAHQTPIFSSVIKNVKIHPDWTSPDSIAERYVIPKIQKNPQVVYKLGYQAISKQTGQVVPWEQLTPDILTPASFTFRQKPGKNNALGLARFSIENDYAIFMHGTPSVNLFKENERTFSSGCIRLKDPLMMAHFLLHDQGVSEAELEDLYYLDDGEFPDTTVIDLDVDVPVHLMYMTAWMDQAGYLHFADDIYGRDKKLNEAFVTLN